MDLNTVEHVRLARDRSDLVLQPGEVLLGGGTWLFSEPQDATGLVDLTTLGWEPWTETAEGLSIAATCTIADLVANAEAAPWPAAPLFRQCAESFLMSFKIWNTATVGGNLCLGLPAGAMISLACTLDAEAVIWRRGGGERRQPVAEFVVGAGETTLAPGEVLRAVEVPASSLRASTAHRRMALTDLGRSAALVTGRKDQDGLVIAVTASVPRPVLLRFDEGWDPTDVTGAVEGITAWYDDPHGAADWRAALTRRLVLEVCEELR